MIWLNPSNELLYTIIKGTVMVADEWPVYEWQLSAYGTDLEFFLQRTKNYQVVQNDSLENK